MPSYGGSIAQNLYYSQSTFCDGDNDPTKGVPTRDTDPKTNKMKPFPSPYILMLDRGDCTFVQKVRVVVVVNLKCIMGGCGCVIFRRVESYRVVRNLFYRSAKMNPLVAFALSLNVEGWAMSSRSCKDS